MAKKNLIVGQSGGPTAVINGSLYGVVSEALRHKEEIGEVYGMIHGIEGFLNKNVLNFEKSLPGKTLNYLVNTPGAYLGSCRYKMPGDLKSEVYEQIFKNFHELNIGYFLYIGGNDSMDTVSKLERVGRNLGSDIQFIGIPKTVDNDLVLTDHTPGFGSAAKYVASTLREIVLDVNAYAAKSVTIVEIMGRHAGWLTASAILARKYDGDNPLLIYLPEVTFHIDKFLEQVRQALSKNNNVVVCISEGIKDEHNRYICEYQGASERDSFGHKKLTGSCRYLENQIKLALGVRTRSIELGVCQRSSSALISAVDLEEAIGSGAFGVKEILKGATGSMVSIVRESSKPYSISYRLQNVNDICNKERKVPIEWIINDGSDVSSSFKDYALPLIGGRLEVPLDSCGLPVYAYRK